MKNLLRATAKFLLIICLLSPGPMTIYAEEPDDNPVRIQFIDDGDQLQGLFYRAIGDGPLPTIILLQGSVGKDGDVLNLGKALSKEGFNVMTYNYPGSWKSDGERTDEAALGSVGSAIKYVKSDSAIETFEIDTSDIILAGYSYGGGMALLGAAKDPSIGKVVSIAGMDFSVIAGQLEKNPAYRNNFMQMIDNLVSNPMMARGPGGEIYVETLLEDSDNYDVKEYAGELAGRDLLLIGGWMDNRIRLEDHILPLYRELQMKGARNTEIMALDTDHGFSHVQEELAEAILNWLIKED